MPPELIHFRGTYRYRSTAELERAVAAAREELDDDEVDPELVSLRCLIRHGPVLSIDIVLPAAAEVRFAAANVFQALAHDAIEGAVDAHHGTRRIDSFPSGED